MSVYIFMLIIATPEGVIVKPEPYSSALACAMRIEAEQSKAPRPGSYGICLAPGVAVELQTVPSTPEAGS